MYKYLIDSLLSIMNLYIDRAGNDMQHDKA